MLVLLSPSKTQDFTTKSIITENIKSNFMAESVDLANIMKNLSAEELSSLMKISPKISELNFNRFQYWNDDFTYEKRGENYNAKQALWAFKGDVYRGFNLNNWGQQEHDFAEKSLRIISGLYGIVTPNTLIKPYRLEMGTRLSFEVNGISYKNLYEFWRVKLTHYLAQDIEKNNADFVLNLASMEYSKAIDLAKFRDKICNVDFKVLKNGDYKTIAIFAKRQRGSLSNWIVENGITNPKDLAAYSHAGFSFAADMSQKNHLVFTKE